jgi:hypothetical protein
MINLNSSLPVATPAATDAALALLQVCADPKSTKAFIDSIITERTKLEVESAKLKGLQAERVALDRERAAHEALVARYRDEHESQSAQLAHRQRMHGLAESEHAERVIAFASHRMAFEAEKAEHRSRLAEFDRLKKLLARPRRRWQATRERSRDVSQNSTEKRADYELLLDHLVRGGQQRFRDGEAESLGGFEVDG